MNRDEGYEPVSDWVFAAWMTPYLLVLGLIIYLLWQVFGE